MITVCTGSPYSCKIIHSMLKIVEHLERGREVYTNVDGTLYHGGSFVNILGTHPNLHVLDDQQVKEFLLHVQPGSLAVINGFSSVCLDIHRGKFFDCWSRNHLRAGTDLIIISENEGLLSRFFFHFPDDPGFHKLFVPDVLCRFSNRFSFFGMSLPLYSFRLYHVDNSYLNSASYNRPFRFDLRLLRHDFYALNKTLKRIRTFFGKEACK